MSSIQTDELELHHNEFEPKVRVPRLLFAVMWTDTSGPRKKKCVFTFLSKPEAKAFQKHVSTKLDLSPDEVSLLHSDLTWEEVE